MGYIPYILTFAAIAAFVMARVLKSPFEYPYFEHVFDVSGKRSPSIDDCLDRFLIEGGFDEIRAHARKVNAWRGESERLVAGSPFKGLRWKQYMRALDDEGAFRFRFVRSQTRYKQKNYVRTPYTVSVDAGSWAYDYDYIAGRYAELEAIGFECTLSAYHSKNQRKLATRALREQVMKRDGYICQICGKYMPDEVGLQVDHIVPVSKGGNTVMSNLQVLCSKCNGAKHDKI